MPSGRASGARLLGPCACVSDVDVVVAVVVCLCEFSRERKNAARVKVREQHQQHHWLAPTDWVIALMLIVMNFLLC